MEDDKKRLKTGLALITFAVVLYAVLTHLGQVFSFLGGVIRILSPFLYAVVIAYILNILMGLFEKLFSFLDRSKSRFLRKTKRPLSIISVFLALLIVIYLMMVFAIPKLSLSVTSLAENISEHVGEFESFLNATISNLGLTAGIWRSVSLNWNDIVHKAGQFVSETVPTLFAFTKNFAGFVISISTGLLISIYLLADKEHILLTLRKLIIAWLPKKLSNRIIDCGIMANRIFKGYFTGMIVNALLLGALCFLVLIVLGIPYAFLISMVIAVTGLIPVLGPLIGSILSIMLVLLIIPEKTLLFAVIIIILQELDSFVIYPRVVGRSIGFGGLWILVSLILGGSLFGITGIIAGIPAFAAIYALVGNATASRLQRKNITIT